MKNILKIALVPAMLTTSCLTFTEAYSQTRGSAGTTSSSSHATDTNHTSTNTMNWDTENTYWRNNYPSRPYYDSSQDYSIYEPAYRYGVDLYNRHPNMVYEDLNQSNLSSEWDKIKKKSTLTWNEAQEAVRDAYNRLYENRHTSDNTKAR